MTKVKDKQKIERISDNKLFLKLLKDSPLRAMIYILSMKVDEIIDYLNKSK